MFTWLFTDFEGQQIQELRMPDVPDNHVTTMIGNRKYGFRKVYYNGDIVILRQILEEVGNE